MKSISFVDNLKQHGERVAIIEQDGNATSYTELIDAGEQLTEGLDSRKIVFLICRNSLEAICGYIAFLRKRLIPVMIHEGIADDLYNNLYEKYQPSYIYQPRNWKMQDNAIKLLEYKQYELLQAKFTGEIKVYDDLALLLTTSGSTGSPKLVRQSYNNINSNTISIADYLGIREEDRAITTMPLSYTYGLSIINSHLLQGACIIVNEYSLLQREFWNLLKVEKATTFGGVPYIYEILKKLRFGRMDLPSLRYLTQAGGKLSKELASEFIDICEQRNMKFIIMYGQTEATARMSYLPWESARHKAGSIGIAIPGGKFSLINEDGDFIIEPEIVGELVYQGDNVTLGYAENQYDLNKSDENKGLLYTGDMAKQDIDGFYYIVGRKKRFLKIFGNRVNLDEVEGLLKAKGYECACAGVDDKMKIYTTSEEDGKNIITHISREIGINPSAFTTEYIKEIPRNESGKILYSTLD